MIPVGAPASAVKKFWPMRDIPTVVWLVLAACAVIAHGSLPEPRWLLIHLIFLGALSHAILVWSTHFAHALLHTPVTPRGRARQNLRLVGLNVGAALVFAGVLSSVWPVVVVGAVGVSASVVLHGWSLVAQMRAALGKRFAITIHYYVAAAVMLPVGATLGVLLARGYGDPWHSQLKLAHSMVNVLGWVGLTVFGTLLTLWPTIVRTKLHDDAVRWSRISLRVMLASIVLVLVGALGWGGSSAGLWVVALGLLSYLTAVLAHVFVGFKTALRRVPTAFSAWSIVAASAWLIVALCGIIGWAVAGAAQGDVSVALAGLERFTPLLAAGFGLQVLVGALSHLVPVAVSKGPSSSRAAHTAIDSFGVFRVTIANAALAVCAAPLPAGPRVVASVLFVATMLSFLVFMVKATKAARLTGGSPVTLPVAASPAGASTLQPAGTSSVPTLQAPGKSSAPLTGQSPYGPARPGSFSGQVATGLVTVLAAVMVAIAVNPSALGGAGTGFLDSAVKAAASDTQPVKTASGAEQIVKVEAKDMRFTPSSVTVPSGTRVIIELTNTDNSNVHDLVFADGLDSGRLAPGASTSIDVGVVSADLNGWCSVLGHKSMGMTFSILVSKETSASESPSASPTHNHEQSSATEPSAGSAANDLDFMAEPASGFTAFDPVLPALSPAIDGQPTVHKETFVIEELVKEVAPGVTQKLWTFNGQFPGPTLHGRPGDIFEITLVNNGSMGHSIDFHASQVAPDTVMRTIAPGESLVYRFTAERAGIWMYHCGTMPMTAHIANGMAGAVIIEPNDLPIVDESYVFVQSEMYLGAQGEPVDADRALSGEHLLDLVAFNGYSNQYVSQPIETKVGKRLRLWVLDVGPSRATSFHVVGSQFDRVWKEGAYLIGSAQTTNDPALGGAQALDLAAAQGGFVELTLPEAGNYAFVSHIMVDAERGAKGILRATD